ncbi:rifamycin-inactivating phosphotransferase [Rhodococcus sp. NPDC047139]|uniref:rifamycin-inactivating phosphotransferase n=1 Tax=Rhodococcus sp. NPDC047139 TaxID=3155141 RepID=UPI0034075AC1
MGYILDLQDIDRTTISDVGGKAANLGELRRIDGVDVPDGFCVTTGAFRAILCKAPHIDELLEQLARVRPEDRAGIAALSSQVRKEIEGCPMPDGLAEEIVGRLHALGGDAVAVRSSATAEDLPTASFAGQQDSYLNVGGAEEVIRHVHKCWASLFTERAVAYRLRNGFGHGGVGMAVIVQRMVFPQASGVLFTADPVISDRTVARVDAGFGLGDELVSGLVNADVYTVRADKVVDRMQRQETPVLTDPQIRDLVHLGRTIEAHFGCPQDIEWCLVGGAFRIVQSRPITTLFPIPEADDDENHVYVSVGHQQMMTDAMKPLGISVWQMTSRAPMRHAGGRLFVDVTSMLASPARGPELAAALGTSDPLIGDALQTVLDRGFVPVRPDDDSPGAPVGLPPASPDLDPAIVPALIAQGEASVAECAQAIEGKSGPALLDFIRADIAELQRRLFDPRSGEAIMAGMEAATRLNHLVADWLGERNVADTISRSVPHNVTSEMGLMLLDVADAIRPYPEVVTFLKSLEDSGFDDECFLRELEQREGGTPARAAFDEYLTRYGMRCVGEIDITRPRWSEQPTALVPAVLSNIENFDPGERRRRVERGSRESRQKEAILLEGVRALPDGEQKADEIKGLIDRIRNFAGYREYPKYAMVARYFVYKQALLREAGRLVAAGVIREKEDIFYLRFDELEGAVRTSRPYDEVVAERKSEFVAFEALKPPRVLLSTGEALSGAYRRENLPEGALVGLAVSAGIVEGRARVVTDISRADLAPGDILVTAYTDPSWTPSFVAVDGLVTEVGGLMTHGAVIAREYGLPAVVGVQNATGLIRDGQRIRVNGAGGYVEILA